MAGDDQSKSELGNADLPLGDLSPEVVNFSGTNSRIGSKRQSSIQVKVLDCFYCGGPHHRKDCPRFPQKGDFS